MLKKINGIIDANNSDYSEDRYCYIDGEDIIDILEDFNGKDVEITIKVNSNKKYKWIRNKKVFGLDYVDNNTGKILATIHQDSCYWRYEIYGFSTYVLTSEKLCKLAVQKIVRAMEKK